MLLKAGAFSLVLLLASRLLGLGRESAQAAAFGTSGMADVAVLMLTLPDWLAGLLASGALAYVLLPHWATQNGAAQAATQRTVARVLLLTGTALGLSIWLARAPVVALLASGLPVALQPLAEQSLGWSALALPAALLAALWSTRLQHVRDFTGLYGANLVVNGVLVFALLLIAIKYDLTLGLTFLGINLLLAMGLRLFWLRWRQRRVVAIVEALPAPVVRGNQVTQSAAHLPAAQVWLWATLSAGLPLTLPFAARSLASQGGEGALATFNYAWKLVELPLVLAIQLVATLTFPAITRAFVQDSGGEDVTEPSGAQSAQVVRGAFALAWTLACAAAAGLLLGAPAVTQLLFGWGRMTPEALERVAAWGAVGAWGLLPQALIAVALTVLATQSRMRWAAGAYALALVVLLAASGWAGGDGLRLMALLNTVLTGVALCCLLVLGAPVRHWLPGRLMAITGGALVVLAGIKATCWLGWVAGQGAIALGLAVAAALAMVALGWLAGPDLRQALRR